MTEGEAIAVTVLLILFGWLLVWSTFKRGIGGIAIYNDVTRIREKQGLPPINI
tara:strand:+ start:157 stop:315 length:159 start_codon:yes stop_codon:yes gene_type:complete